MTSNSETLNTEGNGGYTVNTLDIVQFVATRLQLFIVGVIISIFIFMKIYNKNTHIIKKTILILLPIVIIYLFYAIYYAPIHRLSYLKNKLFGSSSIDTGFYHKGGSGKFPFTGSAVIEINNRQHVFIGGGENQDDVLLLFDKNTNRFNNVIHKYLQVSQSSTYSAVAFDITNNGFDDLIVGYEDGIFIYKQIENGKFIKQQIYKQCDAIPLALSIGDYNKNSKPDIYISYFVPMEKYGGTIFNDLSYNRKNVLLKNVSTNLNIKFIDVTDQTNSGGTRNTFTSAFVDLNNDGYPSIVLSNDSGEIEIMKNMKGEYFETIIPFDYKGNWMGLGIGDINNNGYQDLFLTNLGTDMNKNKISVGDLQPDQKMTFSHILLRNDGNFKFTDITKQSKISGTGFGWGAIIEDLNLDGHNDILFAENFTLDPINWLYPGVGYYYESNQFIKGMYNRVFKYNNPQFGQTPLLVDLNNNGKKDIMWINVSGPTIAYLNGSTNNFISVKLPKSIEFANSKIILNENGSKQFRELIHGGVGFGSGQTDLITFGLGKNKSPNINITIKTIYGKQYIAKNVKYNTRLVLNNFTKI
jgi:hypothetical protein